MIYIVKINGFTYYVNLKEQKLAEDINFKSFTTFNHLTKFEKETIKDQIHFNRIMV